MNQYAGASESELASEGVPAESVEQTSEVTSDTETPADSATSEDSAEETSSDSSGAVGSEQ